MLVGLIEAAEIMGEDIQTIKKLYKHGKFPKAIEEHDRGPAWTREQIEHYKKVQGSNMTVYYHDGRQMWKLKINAPRELFDKTLNEFVDELCTARKKWPSRFCIKNNFKFVTRIVQYDHCIRQFHTVS